MAVIAIDAGTSVIKAVAFDREGKELALVRKNTRVLQPHPAFREQSMEEVWAAAQHTVREVCSLLTEPVTALCLTAQGDGCWLVDEHGEPTSNAILWNDGRAAAAVERWRSSGAIETGRQISGSVTYPGLSNALLAWLQEADPDRLARSRWVLSCSGWLFSRLTGAIVADLSDSSNPFGDLQAGTYSEAAFAAYESTHLRPMFPEVARGEALSQPLSARAAESLGLPEGLPVTMAPYDIVTTAFGAGVVAPGQACVILGTTICAEAITRKGGFEPAASGTAIGLDGGLILSAMPTLAGCETLEWAARMLGVMGLQELGEMAQRAPAGADGVLFLPYLSEAGERSPFLEPHASGSWHGLKLSHSREHLARAVYEGLSFSIRECLAAAAGAVHEVRVCGGGARSGTWCQIIADVTGVPVLRAMDSEVGARGAFLYSGVMRGEFADMQAAADALPARFECFSPQAGNVAVYPAGFERFLRIRELVRGSWAGDSSSQAEVL